MKKNLLILSLLGAMSVYAQGDKKTEFSSPLNISINASGNFGELRGTHFHTGLDIKTQQRISLPVYAPEDGYVSRIKVSTWGYGKALYIDHPNGQTTVYGHLNGYEGAIAELVKKRHYAEKSFEIEIFPRKGELSVKKGEIIAYSGNTGGSGGPHLHYEFRDTKTQNIINPLKEGMDKLLVDTQPPSVNSLFVYPISDDAVANKGQIPQQLTYKTQADGVLLADQVRAKGEIGFGIDIFDTADFNANKNGVYKLETFVNGKRLFAYNFDTFSFNETGFVNALIDYERFVTTKKRIQKLFVEKAYALSVLSVDKATNGLLTVKPGENYIYKIILEDYHGNKKEIQIPVVYDNQEIAYQKKEKQGEYKINSDREYLFEKEQVSITIPAKTFYNDFNMDIQVKNNILKLHENTVPASKNMIITFDTSQMEIANREKAFIGKIDGTRRDFYKTTKKGNLYTIYTKNLGNYQIMIDDKAPEVYNPSFKEGDWLSNANTISFLVKDDLSGINTIEGTVNGKWILLDYDYKTNKIVHKFSDGVVESGRSDVVIKVTDRMGNQTSYETHFFRK